MSIDHHIWDAADRYLAALRGGNPAAAIAAQRALREAVEQLLSIARAA